MEEVETSAAAKEVTKKRLVRREGGRRGERGEGGREGVVREGWRRDGGRKGHGEGGKMLELVVVAYPHQSL